MSEQYQPQYQPTYQNQPVYQQPQYGQQPQYNQQPQYGQQQQQQHYNQPTYVGKAANPPQYGNYDNYSAPAHKAYAQPLQQPFVPSKQLDPPQQSQRFASTTAYRDGVWAIIFILQLITMIVVAIYFFVQAQKDKNNGLNAGGFSFDGKVWGLIAIYLIVAFLLSFGWLQLMKTYSSQLIWFTLILGIVFWFAQAILLFAIGSVAGGIIFTLFGFFNVLYVYLIRSRIPFSAVVLETVVQFIQLFPAAVYYSLGSIFVQGLWILLWIVAVASLTSKFDNNSSGQNTQGVAYFFLLVSFYWTSQVIKNVVHVTTAGTFASWYFLYPSNMPENPTKAAFKRATTTSFGSICLGSLIIAVVKAMRNMAEQGRRSNNDFARCLCLCILQCLENLIQFFNQYAFTQVAIYGKTYCEAAKSTWELLKYRGFDLIINDNIIGGVLVLGAVIVGLITGAIGIIFSKFVFNMDFWALWGVVGLLVGMGISICAMEVIESSVCACFVCYCEDPEALQRTKPDVYARFTNAVNQRRAELTRI